MKSGRLLTALLCLGGSAAQAGDGWLETRNEWVRIVEWDRLAGNLTADERTWARESLLDADGRWKASLSSEDKEVVVEAAIATVPPLPTRRRIYERNTVSARPASPADVLARADAARHAGQLDNALRLYRIAARMPGGEAGAERAGEIEREMSGQPAR